MVSRRDRVSNYALSFGVRLVIAFTLSAGLLNAQDARRADLVFKHGAIYTVDASRSWANAVAIQGGKIIYVGTNSGVQQYISRTTRVIDLQGKMILPGFSDSHVHPVSSGRQLNQCVLTNISTVTGLLDAVKRCKRISKARHGLLVVAGNCFCSRMRILRKSCSIRSLPRPLCFSRQRMGIQRGSTQKPVLGPERSHWLYAIGSVMESGAVVVGGSDWSVTSLNPLEAIQVGVTRYGLNDAKRTSWLPDERAGLAAMIAAYTINGAYLAHREERTGSIEAGKDADLVVLSANLFTTPVESIHKVKVLLTLLEGREVFRDSSLDRALTQSQLKQNLN